MANKDTFTADEMYQLWKAPYIASLAVIAAQPGGLIAEMVASVQYVARAREHYKSELLQSILVIDQDAANAYSQMVAADAREHGITNAIDVLELAIGDIRNALKILRTKAEPEEIQEYKQMIIERAETIAQAGKEGSFLGFGGVHISAAEEQVLAEIRLAVNRLN